MADYVLEVKNVDKVYGQDETEVYALRNLSFSVKRGEFMLIVGSSGSGNSSAIQPTAVVESSSGRGGHVRWFGLSPTQERGRRALAARSR